MKLSAFYKKQGHYVRLLLSYDEIENYDKVFISKVFTDTEIPEGILNLSWVEHGGTGTNNLEYDSVLVGNGTNAVSTRPIETQLINNNNLATNRAIIQYITDATAGITGAMHFIGEATVEITNNSAVNPRIQGYNFSAAQPGDVILFGSAEYVKPVED